MSVGGVSGGDGVLEPWGTAAAAPPPGAAEAPLRAAAFAGDATLREVAAGRATLALNSRGEPARIVQRALVDLGFLSPRPGADGIFGPLTFAAVQAFQRSVGLAPAGIVDAATLLALDAKAAERGAPAAPVPGRPPIVAAPPPEPMRVVEGTSEYSLDDDTLIMVGEGRFASSIGREIYVAGYLPRTDGPLFRPLGTDAPPSAVLSEADRQLNATRSPVERFDEAMRRATGTPGGMAARYAVDGRQPEAQDWWATATGGRTRRSTRRSPRA